MIRFARFFGCFSLAVLSLSGCSTGTVFDTYPGAAAVLGLDEPDASVVWQRSSGGCGSRCRLGQLHLGTQTTVNAVVPESG